MQPTRRTVLAGVATLLAGCGSDAGEDTDGSADPPTEQRPREMATDGSSGTGAEDGTECSAGLLVYADRFDPVEQLPLSPRDENRTLVERAVSGGGAETTSYHHEPPVPSGAYVEVDEQYHRLRAEQTDRSEVPALELNVEWRKGRSPPDGATVVGFESLPAVDRAALQEAVFGDGDERRGLPERGLSIRESPVPYPDGLDHSRLAAAEDRLWIRWKDRPWEVWRGDRTTKARFTYRLTAEAVADTDAAFRAHVRDAFLLTRSRFETDEREILRTAAPDQYRECEPLSDAADSLLARLDDSTTLPPPFEYSWLVELDEGCYRVETMDWTA